MEEAAVYCKTLFAELAPRIEADRALERELDRYLARRFNVFEYVRTDELGWSRVIADLLDPTQDHGQGTLFLEAMLDAFDQTRDRFARLFTSAGNPIMVRREHGTASGGRIDITIEIPDGDRIFCLAFENKPYAPQSADQVTRYLRFLNSQYGQHFLLVYLPPKGRGPSRQDLSPSDRLLWEKRFVAMPYVGKDSLADWFASCSQRCKASRVRAFLRDVEAYCRKRFGKIKMAGNRETWTVLNFLLENPKYLGTALAVREAWMPLRDEVCRRFLEHLRNTVESRLQQDWPDLGLTVFFRYKGVVRYANDLQIGHHSWDRYDIGPKIRLQSHGKGPLDWFRGVSHGCPKPSEIQASWLKTLNQALRDQGLQLEASSAHWFQFNRGGRFDDWYALVPELHEECESGGGTITEYFTNELLNISRLAIPALDGVCNTSPG